MIGVRKLLAVACLAGLSHGFSPSSPLLTRLAVPVQPSTTTALSAVRLPTPFELAGKILPYTRGLPNGSVEAAAGTYTGDIVLIALAAFLPPLLNDLFKESVPKKFRRFTPHFEVSARIGGLLFVGNIFDAVFAKIAGRLVIGGTLRSVLFLLLWWLPTRASLFKLVGDRLQWIADDQATERGIMNRMLAVAVYLSLAVLVRDSLALAVSPLLGFGIMPVLVALLGV